MRLSQAACTALLANPWVGNVRQLQNVISRAVTMAERTIISADELELPQSARTTASELAAAAATLDEALADFEKRLRERLYRDFPSTRQLARRLGVSHSAIAVRLRRYGIGGRSV